MSNETEPRISKIDKDYVPSIAETEQIPYPERTGKSYEKPGNKKRAKMFGTAIGGLAILVGGGLVTQNTLSQSQDNETPEPAPTPTAEAPVTPGETPIATAEPTAEPSPTDIPETPVTSPETEGAFEIQPIPADVSKEDLASRSSDIQESWAFAGATDESIQSTGEKIMELWAEHNADPEAIYLLIAEQNAEAFADTFLPEDFRNNERLSSYYEGMITKNASFIGSADSRSIRGEPLVTQETTISDVVELESDPGTRTIQFTMENTFVNRGDSEQGVVTQTFDISDGTARLIDSSAIQQ